MVEEVSVAQAQSLLRCLYEQVNEISEALTRAQHRIGHTAAQSPSCRHQRLSVAEMRKDLYEAHRLIDRLHHRYPATHDVAWPTPRHHQPQAV
ncbi:hypothetical protein [Mycobacteroides salmoniphilum]|uniref:Uncharacterized protein n=1 Tax=Mycobacteroides salmoniphilum TaxID=404941 RepID=A0A4V3HZC5_9MYCO|nr:hypothetical protein [Mycobacteroides salmoniphilum]TDZ93464.1 hypothetical protein CCUG60885_03067 [Mycobacteroides salmoniphilum]TEA09247.1 hypothetical protein CCUG60883_00008 [Mycobacteroides salmoniphilum]